MNKVTKENLKKINNNIFEIPKSFRADMNVPARVIINENLLEDILQDKSLDQLVNVATLPGIVKNAFAMPDIHQGYGFPIGGVAGFDINKGGIISPGGIGYDINCGVRLLSANINAADIKKYLPDLATALFNSVPSGIGRAGKIKLSIKELNKVIESGAKYMLSMGYGVECDLEYCEENGNMAGADSSLISEKAKERGADQLGTLGSGNHFLEIQKIAEIYDEQAANIFGLKKDMVTIMIHCGSRGLGHQTCTDYVKNMITKLDSFDIKLPDRELSCAPFLSSEGQNYFKAMIGASNFAWANRHIIGHNVRQVFKKQLGDFVDIKTVYDLSHNIGKIEQHIINNEVKSLIMHRKGATRAFGPNRVEVPQSYRSVGHPVLVPGTMGTASYVLVGTEQAMEISLGSSCHGAGRRMSRIQAKKNVSGQNLAKELADLGIIIRCESDVGLAEEAPLAYKDVDSVVNILQNAGVAKKVVRLVPLAVIKGG